MEEIVIVLTEGLLLAASGDLCPLDTFVSIFSCPVGCPIKFSSKVPCSAHVIGVGYLPVCHRCSQREFPTLQFSINRKCSLQLSEKAKVLVTAISLWSAPGSWKPYFFLLKD